MSSATAAFALALGLALASAGCDKQQGPSPGGEPAVPAAAWPSATASAGAGAGADADAGAGDAQGSAVMGSGVGCEMTGTDFAALNSAKPGTPILARCAACPVGTIWGTDLYASDSRLCSALVHSGAIPASGGSAAVTLAAGQLTYVGSSRNGIKSLSDTKERQSFYVQPIDAQGQPTGAAPTVYDDHSALLACGMGDPFHGQPGDRFTAVCTGDCTPPGGVWGSNPYTGDTDICTAARHAGLVAAGSTTVTVTLGGPLHSFPASTANGVTSRDYGAFDTSYTLSKPVR